MAWKCNYCGKGVESMTHGEFIGWAKIKKNGELGEIKDIETKNAIPLTYICRHCGNNSYNLKDIAYWEED